MANNKIHLIDTKQDEDECSKSDSYQLLEEQSYYHGVIMREATHDLLKEPGDFLLREKRIGGVPTVCLSVRVLGSEAAPIIKKIGKEDVKAPKPATILHIDVVEADEGGYHFTDDTEMFKSVPALIQHYQYNGFPLPNGIFLKRAVNKPRNVAKPSYPTKTRYSTYHDMGVDKEGKPYCKTCRKNERHSTRSGR